MGISLSNFNFWLAFGDDEGLSSFRYLLMFLYGSVLLWLMLVEMLRSKVHSSRHRGFFEFHMMSFPIVALGSLIIKIKSMLNADEMLVILGPHLLFVTFITLLCGINWGALFKKSKRN